MEVGYGSRMVLALRAAPTCGRLCIRWRVGACMECFWLDARRTSFEIQVLVIWSMMTAGIRAALEVFRQGPEQGV